MIGVVADDLTGAAELGAVGLRFGLRAQVVFSGPAAANADLVCVDTDSRSCSAAEAGRRAATAARQLADQGASWVYKKVDSVLRGQVAAEIEAIMRELGLPRALLVPANPSLGRTIEAGHYFIHGTPIDKTEFVADPEYPRTSARVLELLNAPATIPVQTGKNDCELPSRGVLIGEARSTDDLQQWAVRRSADMLFAGGAEFFAALLGSHARPGSTPQPLPGHSGRTFRLFVCGTTSASARDFLRQASESGTPLFTLPPELAAGGEFTDQMLDSLTGKTIAVLQRHSTIILAVGLPLVRDAVIAKSLHRWLARWAKAVLERAPGGHVYAEGGATARELVRQMGWQRLNIASEMALGIATLQLPGQPVPLLTIKPGSYRWPDAIRSASRSTQPRQK